MADKLELPEQLVSIITRIMFSTADMMHAVLESNTDDLKVWAKASTSSSNV